jgi:hypothetical protein
VSAKSAILLTISGVKTLNNPFIRISSLLNDRTDIECETDQPYPERRLAVAFSMATLLSKPFGLRLISPYVERCPTFVNKDSKSFKAKHFLQRNKKVSIHS